MPERIIIIGGGFGGLEAAFTLKGLMRSAEITLINRSADHFFVPSIHEIISNKVKSGELRFPLATVLRPAKIAFVQDEVAAVDPGLRQVRTNGQILTYDFLILASGAEHSFFSVPGAEQFSHCFRTPEDAEEIHKELALLLENNAPSRSIVLAGGGTEGVEVAGELLDLISQAGGTDDLRSGRIAITLVEAQGRLLPGFAQPVQAFVEGYLSDKGVTIVAGSRIAEVLQHSLTLNSGRTIASSLLIWTGGIQPSKLIRDLVLPKDPAGWLKVTQELHSPGDDRIFGIGDAVSIYRDNEPMRFARLAYHAQDQARVAAFNIANYGSGESLLTYAPKNKPQLVSMGKDMGIFIESDAFRSGAWVVALKKAIEKRHLLGYLSRPLSTALWSKIPGSEFARKFWLRKTT